MNLFLYGLLTGTMLGTFIGVVVMCALMINRMPPIQEDILGRVYETPKRRGS
jgi:uncharacterized protein YneF (UPF0154 family)